VKDRSSGKLELTSCEKSHEMDGYCGEGTRSSDGASKQEEARRELSMRTNEVMDISIVSQMPESDPNCGTVKWQAGTRAKREATVLSARGRFLTSVLIIYLVLRLAQDLELTVGSHVNSDVSFEVATVDIRVRPEFVWKGCAQ
jgi:hypothetical protein